MSPSTARFGDPRQEDPVGRPGPAVAVSALGRLGLLAVGLGFAVVLSPVAAGWPPLHGLDQQVVDALNAQVSRSGAA